MSSKRRPREDPCHICGHYHDYEGGEPCSICGHVMAPAGKKQGETVIPANIIPGFLYLGSYDTASRSGLLKTMGITHILNTVPTCQELFKNTFTYHTVTSTPPSYQECFDFVEDTRQQPESKILIYCMSGVSRSPAVVIAYLMKSRSWRLAESYKWVKDKRPNVIINAEESKRLMDLEQSLYNSCSAPQGLAALDTFCGAFPTMTHMPAMDMQSASPSALQSVDAAQPPVFTGGGQQAWSMSSQPVGAGLVFGAGPPDNGQGGQQAAFCFGSSADYKSNNENSMEM